MSKKHLTPLPGSRAARLMALSQEAQEQSVDAIRNSLRLLRQPAYPADRPIVSLGQPVVFDAVQERCRDDRRRSD